MFVRVFYLDGWCGNDYMEVIEADSLDEAQEYGESRLSEYGEELWGSYPCTTEDEEEERAMFFDHLSVEVEEVTEEYFEDVYGLS